jgi:adenylate kinase
MNIVFLGPPGSGKGTQAAKLAQAEGLTHLSTGDLFRDNIARKTDLGTEIQSYVESGKLVPDELVSRVVFEKLKSLTGGKGFLLDGYPRTVGQAQSLEAFSKSERIPVDAVFFFNVDFPELVKRLSARRQCGSCKEVYNLINRPTKKEGICDTCGSALIHRPDDKPEVVDERLQVYKRQTEPVLVHYKGHAGFHTIDAAGTIDGVFAQIRKALAPKTGARV